MDLSPSLVFGAVALFVAALVFLSRTQSAHKPPVVKYWLPWIGSAFALGKDPDGFFRRATEMYGHVFTVKAFGRSLTYVTSPSLINEVYRNPQKFDFEHFRMGIVVKLFRFNSVYSFAPVMHTRVFPAYSRGLSPLHVKPLLRSYSKHIHTLLVETLDKFDGASTPFVDFIIPTAYKAGAYAYYGRSFPAEETYKLFREFDSVFHLFLAGVPDFFLRKNINAWYKLLAMIEDYVKKMPDDSFELIHVLKREVKGEGFTDSDVAKSLGADLWALQANAIWAAYWIIVLQIQRPEGLHPLIQEIDEARVLWAANNPDAKFEDNIYEFIAEAPLLLLVSTIRESLRYSSFVMSIRDVQEPLEFGGYRFDKGQQILCATRTVHQDDEIFENAQEFIPDRFMKTTNFMKGGKPVPNHSMYFGGGVSQCQGRHFALGELKTIVALMLLYSTIEIDPESKERPSFNMERFGSGILQPKGDLQVIIRRRDLIF